MSHRHWTRLLLSLLLLASSVGIAHAAPTLTIEQQGLARLTITWSGAPPDALVMYGLLPVGSGSAGAVIITPAVHPIIPGRAAVLLDGANQELARAVTMGLAAGWESTRLHVTWGAPEPGCLVLSGGPPDQLLDLPCAAAGDVRLPSGGVDQAYAPQRYARIDLRAQSDLGRTLASAPTWRLVLPIIQNGQAHRALVRKAGFLSIEEETYGRASTKYRTDGALRVGGRAESWGASPGHDRPRVGRSGGGHGGRTEPCGAVAGPHRWGQ